MANARPVRQTADLSGYPDLVVIYLGMESVFLDMPPTGFTAFSPTEEARQSLFSARRRMRLSGTESTTAPVSGVDALPSGAFRRRHLPGAA